MRALVVVLVLGSGACLATTHHDGPWPCYLPQDCSGSDVCVTLTGLGQVCAPPGSCRANEDCFAAGYGEGQVCVNQFCSTPQVSDAGGEGSATGDFCTSFTTCSDCVSQPASSCDWCSTGGCVSSANTIGTACPSFLATAFDCHSSVTCAPCTGSGLPSSVCGGTTPTECDCNSGGNPSSASCVLVQSSIYGPTWCCP
jgi:hypothetical protein